MTIDRLSASSVKKFYECPKQYNLRYIDKYEVPEDDENKFILLGSDVHNAIEEVLKENPDLRDEEFLLELFKGEDANRYPDSMDDKAEKCFVTFAKYISKYVDEIQDIEEEWTMDYRGMGVIGYCDLIADDSIIDWKTGSSEDKEVAEKIQASFYIKLYEEEYGKLPEKVVFVYGNEGELSVHKRITDDGTVIWNNVQNKYWEDVEKIISQMLMADNKNDWPATPENANCYFCQYKYHCAQSPIGSENVERHHIDIGIP